MRLSVAAAVVCLSLTGLSVGADAEAALRRPTNIPAQGLGPALQMLAKGHGFQIVYVAGEVNSLRTHGASGDLTVAEALAQLLRGTGLTYRMFGENGVSIVPIAPAAGSAPRANTSQGPSPDGQDTPVASASSASSASASDTTSSSESTTQASAGMPEILVKGSKILNMDIKRSRDDAQPYVLFERETIEQSGAVGLQDFLKRRLPMNSVRQSNDQNSTASGATSSIALRGLGTEQTLILIDGRRIPSINNTGSFRQNDLNGIPLSAIERIEILPTTASGIHGGAATGGVINIILRRDYDAGAVTVSYENSFEADSAIRQVEFSQGFRLEGGRTSLLFAGQYSDAQELVVQDREFVQRGLATIQSNNPGFFANATTPPLGPTTNIRSVNGSPLFGPGTPGFTSVPAGYAGGGGLAPLAVNAGNYNLSVSDNALLNGGGRGGLLNGPELVSLLMTARREFGSRMHAYVDLSGSNNVGHFPTNQTTSTYTIAANALNNPFGQAIRVTVPSAAADGEWNTSTFNRRALAGVIVELPKDWMASADFAWGRVRTHALGPDAFAPNLAADIGNGTLDVLRDLSLGPDPFTSYVIPPPPSGTLTPFRSVTTNPSLRLSGPLGAIPGGKILLSTLLEYRKDQNKYAEIGNNAIPQRSQAAKSAYLEVRFPIVSALNPVAGVQELEFQLAARHDRYTVEAVTQFINLAAPMPVTSVSTQHESTDPTIGVRYRPLPDVLFRASYGTGFLPPSSTQLLPSAPIVIAPGSATDPRRGNEPIGQATRLLGGSLSLRPEDSESWSAGLVLTPNFMRGLRLSVDYVRIEKSDNISILGVQQQIENEAFFADRIGRAPVTPGDPFEVGRITLVDTSFINAAKNELEAYDLAIDYEKQTASLGTFTFFAAATRQTHFKTQLTPTTPLIEQVGSTAASSTPLELKGNAGVTWNRGAWTVGWTSFYFDSYRHINPAQILNQGADGIVPSQTYHDVFANWAAPTDFGMAALSDLEVQVGVKNVFNTKPPYDASNSIPAFLFYSAYGDPRLATYHVSLRKRL